MSASPPSRLSILCRQRLRSPVLIPGQAWRHNCDRRPYIAFLTLDGGGLRGIISSTVLVEVEKQIKQYVLTNLEDFDLANPPPGREKESYNYNTINDFFIYIADFFHGIAGISAGSWISAYLVTKGGNGRAEKILRHPSIVEKYGSIRAGAAEGLRVFFLEYGTRVYPPALSPISLEPRAFAVPQPKVKGITKPFFNPKGLEWVLKEFNGDVKLSEVHTSLLVVTFDLSRMSAVEFIADYLDARMNATDDIYIKPEIYTGVCISRSDIAEDQRKAVESAKQASGSDSVEECGIQVGYSAMEKLCGLDYYVRDIVRASSAFPMVNPSKLVKPLNDVTNYFDMIDGAMVGNNPTMPAIAWALSHKSISSFTKTAFLSLGTGFAEGSSEELADGGVVQWAVPFIGLITGSTPEFMQALMDYAFYVQRQNKEDIKPNQLLRIQLIRDASTPEGAMLLSITPNRQQALKMEEMAEQLGAQYRENIYQFVETFLCKKTDAISKEDKKEGEKEGEKEVE